VSEELRAQLKTVLDREAETHRRHDAKVEAQAAEIERLQDALIRASRDIQGYKDALAQVGEDW
jgi:predicted RNase H-like nuclease (RuvC/YqgF family)